MDAMAEIIKFMRRYMTAGDLAQYQTRETSPGTGVSTDGSAPKMLREWGGVIDKNLVLYGVKQSRVADASMMPGIAGAANMIKVQTQRAHRESL
ncbi:hypothetical protein LZ30DRAFT_786795 [Colletotrichum cereale]|nr:hypothetical protein LZ30DRAFT_786795 [Colletotrichum cereale]